MTYRDPNTMISMNNFSANDVNSLLDESTPPNKSLILRSEKFTNTAKHLYDDVKAHTKSMKLHSEKFANDVKRL